MIFRFAIDSIINYLRQSFMTTLLLIISIMLIIFSTMIRVGHDYVYRSVDEFFSNGADNTVILRIEDNNPDYMNELSRQPEIEAVGCSTTFGIYPFSELYEIQKQYKSNTEDSLEVIEINHTAASISKINVVNGSNPEDLDYTPQNGKLVEYMYLGSYYSEIPIGSKYETKETIFIVAGILDSSQRWINETLLYGFDLNTMDYTIDCKSCILSFYDGPPSSSDMWVCASDDYNTDQVIDVVYRLADKYNAEVRYTTLRTSYERAAKDWIVLNNILSKLIVIVCFSCFLMLLCYQTYRLLIMKKEIGILLSVGFEITAISKSLILSNIILSLVSFLISLPLSLFVVKWWFQANNMMEVVNKILIKYSYPISLVVIICVIAISSVLLIKLLNKLTPVEMIGGQND